MNISPDRLAMLDTFMSALADLLDTIEITKVHDGIVEMRAPEAEVRAVTAARDALKQETSDE